ncbi:signal peptidase II [Candidatus Curtissbacteria bacterium]|nr:signal peptidase II [Candidatus Curtissbacteria bacterium]
MIKSKIFISSAVIVSIIILDQVTKAFVLGSGIPSACNTGVAFGFISGFPNLLISFAVLSVIVYMFAREPSYSSSPLGREVFTSTLSFSRKSTTRIINSERESRTPVKAGSRIKYGMTMISSHFVRTISKAFCSRQARTIGYSLIIGGSLSNIGDRLIRGCVIDYINLGWWPAFNLADAAIIIGVGILIFSILSKSKAKNFNDLNH